MQRLISATMALTAVVYAQTPANNATEVGKSIGFEVLGREVSGCKKPGGAVPNWMNERDGKLYTECISVDGSDLEIKHKGTWVMLNSYRDGGKEDVHWRRIKPDNDTTGCLENWIHFSSNGTTVIGYTAGKISTQIVGAPWCPLKVYRHGGVKGYQWDECYCP